MAMVVRISLDWLNELDERWLNELDERELKEPDGQLAELIRTKVFIS
jgi:hypothetical protein